ncbi:MAG: ABC transporter ATP-binding protein [Ginsengibacter sp.]
MPNNPLLQIKNLSVDFIKGLERNTAVNGISLEVNKGEMLAIVGESGSGKSVTALSVLRLLPVPPARYTSGEILFSAEGSIPVDILRLKIDEMRHIRGNKISMIFQEPMTSLNPVHKCGDQVMEAIQQHTDTNHLSAKRETIRLFEQAGLSADMLDRYPHQLSGGQKQRVMIAMAMSCNPSLLIADEPTTALDVTVQKTILQLIKKLQNEFNMGVIYITHDLGLIVEIADKVAVMYKGSIVETGTVKEIFTQAQHPYTRALIACRPVISSKGKRLPVVGDFMNEPTPEKKEIVETEESVHDRLAAPFQSKPDGDVLLDVKNLCVYFPVRKNFFGKTLKQFKAIDDVSFHVMKGETLGLVGESGSGKSTLGRTLLRLIEPTSGNILLEGKDIAHFSKREMRKIRKNIQIIFQDPYGSLNPRLTIGSAISEPMKIHGLLQTNQQRKDKVMELLEKVDLKPAHYSRYPHEFSGGQRQRICIARALGINPGFIICDESVSALDVSVQAQVLNLLSDLKKEFGFTCIFISHDLRIVRYISDRMLVMHKGRIEEIGPADEVYFNPKSVYTKKLIASIPAGLL